MAQWVLELARASVDLTGACVAAAPDGGAFIAVLDVGSAPYHPTVLRVDADGDVLWQKQLTLPGGANTSAFAFAANGTNVALTLPDFSTSDQGFVVLFDGTDGSIVWQKQLPFTPEADASSRFETHIVAVSDAGDVFVAGKINGTTTSQRLVKLAAADGSLVWAINPRDTAGGSLSYNARSVHVDSAGDVLVSFVSTSSHTPTLYKFNGSTGALTWARKFVFPGSPSPMFAAVDPADNVYVAVKDLATASTIMVAKLDSSGATLWDKQVTWLSGTSGNDVTGGMAADSGHVYIASMDANGGGDYQRMAVLELNAAGTSASCVKLENPVEPYAVDDGSSVSAEAGIFFSASMERATNKTAVILRNDVTDMVSAAFTPFNREAVGVVLAGGSTTITSVTPTTGGTVSISVSAGGITSADDTLSSAVYEGGAAGPGPEPLIRFAYSLGPTVRFGVPRWSNAYPAESLGPTTQFGTPALDYNLEAYAASLGPTTRFGVPYAFAFFGAQPPHYTPGIGQVTRFGTPTAVVTGAFAAATIGLVVRFGVPTAVCRQAASSLGPVATFGTPVATMRQRASSLGPLVHFGLPAAAGAGTYAASSINSTRFGTPAIKASGTKAVGAATGFSLVVFGVPVAVERHLAKSLSPGTRFGVPSITRTCP